ncbi:amidase [Acuticoccus sp. M5D2P5]|uniref:amidase n=1 Tax=Acuticoccus kalidii TaxID=2910977 RepID=UPI001F42FA43|nr:amidase [Acuticoccus kalidii]MCF3935915.1 amidase [Acuticoccus kalidii]
MSALSAVELAERIAAGALSAREMVEACLTRIAERDGEIHAFAHLDPDYARAQADALDRHRKSGRPLGPLHGIPIGIKDIIDTADYPTENGSPLDVGRRPKKDAALVARLRAAGAVIIGKTITTEFAFLTPGPTRNPHNTAHTPGGSSQGSAAAVADGMIPLAVGTQTAGSVIRPASFCGVVAAKPSYGAVSMTGALTICEPFDTAGIFATTLEDAALILDAMFGFDPSDARTRPAPAPRLLAAVRSAPPLTPQFAIVKGPTWSAAEPALEGLLGEIAETLGDAADFVDLPDAFDNMAPAHWRIMVTNFARNLSHYVARDPSGVSQRMRDAIAEGAETSAVDYMSALDWKAALASGLDRVFDRYDAIITPAAPGEAPEGHGSTGNSAFNQLWTFVGAPAITLPVAKGPKGLPIGIQIVGRPGEDARLFRTARWLQDRLAEA